MAAFVTPPAVLSALSRMGHDAATWRRLRRLQVTEVADRAGVSRHTVMRLEAGGSISTENLLRISRALGVLEELSLSLDPLSTDVGRLRAEEELPKRVRRPQVAGPT